MSKNILWIDPIESRACKYKDILETNDYIFDFTNTAHDAAELVDRGYDFFFIDSRLSYGKQKIDSEKHPDAPGSFKDPYGFSQWIFQRIISNSKNHKSKIFLISDDPEGLGFKVVDLN